MKTDELTIIPRDAGGQNSSVGSVLGSLSCLMLRRGFDPPLGLGSGDFSLGVNMSSDSIP